MTGSCNEHRVVLEPDWERRGATDPSRRMNRWTARERAMIRLSPSRNREDDWPGIC